MTLGTSIMTVSDLTAGIKHALQTEFSSITVKGEMSNVTLHSRGHLYFDLKDSQAKIACVCFHFKTKYAITPKEGDAVVIQGSVTVYAPQGKYQIAVDRLTFSGLGELLLRFERLKNFFSEKGYFDCSIKKALPQSPVNIGVITSPTGAVIRDIINVLSRRSRSFRLILNPVRVQGPGSPEEIADALKIFNERQAVDVIILARGGGSIEDLWSFNEPIVVESIFKSRVPVISAIGHETDFTLSDFVADLRAPTPSAAAELITVESVQEEIRLLNLFKQAFNKALFRLKQAHNQLLSLKKQLELSDFHRSASQRSDYLKDALDRSFRARLDRGILKLSLIKRSAIHAFSFNNFSERLWRLLESLNPSIANTILQTKQLLLGYRNIMEHLCFRIKNRSFCLKDLSHRGDQLNYGIIKTISSSKKMLDLCVQEAGHIFHSNLNSHKQRFERCREQLEALHPDRAFKRGFSMLLDFNTRSAIFSKQDLLPETRVLAVFRDGEASLFVDKN